MSFDDLCIDFLLMDIHIYFNIDKTFRPYFEYSKYIYIDVLFSRVSSLSRFTSRLQLLAWSETPDLSHFSSVMVLILCDSR